MTCFACTYSPEPRPVAVRNEYGDYACDRHLGRLWTLTASQKFDEMEGRAD